MGTSSSGAANAAANANAQNQQTENTTIGQINSAFSSPAAQQQNQNYLQQLQQYYTNNVNQQQQVNARNLNFAQARSGLSGGSAASDANTQLQKDYTQGLLQASSQAQSGLGSLEQSEQAQKNALTSLAQSGANVGSVAQDVGSAMSSAITAGQSNFNANALGNLFSQTGGIVSNEQTAAAQRQAQMNPLGSVYGVNPYQTQFAGPSPGGYGAQGPYGYAGAA